MSQFPNSFGGSGRPMEIDYESRMDAGVTARFFNAVYGWMAAGLALTAVVAWYVSTNAALMKQIFHPGILIGLFIAELALVMTVSAAVRRISAPVATVLFLAYAALNGLTLSAIFLVYSGASLALAFTVTAGMFGTMSVYGLVTRRDLSGWGSILFMGLIGFILASVVNVFWANSFLTAAITYGGVLIFVGLTAYDTQRLKVIALQTARDPAMAARWAINGALQLYLDFLNLFLLLLRILGDRR